MSDLFTTKNARFSECGKHRYSLTRTWDKSKGHVMFIGLNPSTADQQNDDPTIRRVTRFARDWGYGGVVMCNLFTQVTPYPKELDTNQGLEITQWAIANELHKCKKVVFAWGNFQEAAQRGKEISNWIKNAYALQINKNGSPKHPLYVRADIQPVKYN